MTRDELASEELYRQWCDALEKVFGAISPAKKRQVIAEMQKLEALAKTWRFAFVKATADHGNPA